MTMTEAYEESVYREGYRKGKEETIKELMAWHDRVCEEMAKRHTADGYKMLDDGTLVVSVDDATKVTRVLVEDSEKNGDLYYADRPSGKWTIRFVKVDNGMGGTYRERRWYCSACSGWQTYGETDFCPNCGARMKGAEAPSIDICFCRECEHFWKYSNLPTKCVFHLSLVNADDFCSYGVKKGADNE